MFSSQNVSKSELSHQTMMRYHIRVTISGARKVVEYLRRNPLVCVLVLVLSYLIYKVQDNTYTAEMGAIGHGIVTANAASAALLLVLLLAAGCYWFGRIPGAKEMYQNYVRAGVVNSAGEAPLLVQRAENCPKDGHLMLTFKIVGIPLERWQDLSSTIAAALGLYVVNIKQADTPYTYIIHAIIENALPTKIDWSPESVPTTQTDFALGVSVEGQEIVNIQNDPGILTAGATGSGKTLEVKVLLAQAIIKKYIVIIADYKYVEFGGIWGAKGCYIAHDDDSLLWVMEHLTQRLHERRNTFAAEDCRNIDDYNEKHPEAPLHRIALCIDEAAIALDTRTTDKDKKAKRQKIVEMLNEIACTGRFVGIMFVISLQRPSAEVLSGELRNNITTRVVGKCDNNLAMLALDNADAAKLVPKDTPGRFYTSSGKLIQGYYWQDHMLAALPNLPCKARQFLTDGEGLNVSETAETGEEK